MNLLVRWERPSQPRRPYTRSFSSLLSSPNVERTCRKFDASPSSSFGWIHASETTASQPFPIDLHRPITNQSETVIRSHDWCFQGFDCIDTDFFQAKIRSSEMGQPLWSENMPETNSAHPSDAYHVAVGSLQVHVHPWTCPSHLAARRNDQLLEYAVA